MSEKAGRNCRALGWIQKLTRPGAYFSLGLSAPFYPAVGGRGGLAQVTSKVLPASTLLGIEENPAPLLSSPVLSFDAKWGQEE